MNLNNSGHFVDFHADDTGLVAAAAGFLQEGLAADCSIIAVFSCEHQSQLHAALRTRDLDPEQLISDYRLVELDAHALLHRLWIGGRLDMSGFYSRMSSLIHLTGSGGRGVWVVGELAGLLASRGELAAVMQLEELCNDLSREHIFRLYCLYCESAFSQPLDAASRRRVCAVHSGSLRTH